MTFTEMLRAALNTVIAFLPNLLAALLILVVGLLVAVLLDRVTRRVLESIHLSRRRGMRWLVENESMLERVPRTVGRIVFWGVALITLGLTIDALQLKWLSEGMGRVFAYLPSVLAAAAIIVGAYVLNNYIRRRTTRTEAQTGQPTPRLWPDLLRAAIWVVAGFMALQELGIATTIVTSAFVISLGAISIAGAVAFGLGNRELAGRITRDWYDRRRSERGGVAVEGPSPASPLPQH